MSDPQLYFFNRCRALMPGKTGPEIADALVNMPEVRRALTKNDPLSFALVYLSHHLRGEDMGGLITLSEFHQDLIEVAKSWMEPVTAPRQGRHAFVAPRSAGKSTWAFTLLPLWAAAHQHVRFIAAFSDSATQAEGHLQTFKSEIDNNALLRLDYPELCKPAMRRSGVQVSDNRQLMQQANGFVFAAKGLDSASLGLKVRNLRPDLLLLDDIEPGESQYSAYQMERRLKAVQDDVLFLNERARVMLTGTTTMSGSIVHQLVRSVTENTPEKWIADSKFTVHYWPAILKNDDGSERSVWPEKWSLGYLDSIRHTRDYAKNFANLPIPDDSAYWTFEDFSYGSLEAATRCILSIDPAVTTKTSSDQTALAVVAFSPSERRCEVKEAIGVRLRGAELRTRVLQVLAQYPEITRVVIESNQGGETWHDVLHDLPVRVVTLHQSEKKEFRAARLLNHYQRRPSRILHSRKLRELEQQMVEFPRGAHDDLIDAVGTGVDYLTKGNGRPSVGVATHSYV